MHHLLLYFPNTIREPLLGRRQLQLLLAPTVVFIVCCCIVNGSSTLAFVGQYMISTSWHTGGSSSSCSRQRIVLLLRLFLVMVGSTPTVAGFVIAKEV